MDRPVIGLLPLWDLDMDSYWMLPGYLRGVEEAGGVPVILPPRADEAALNTLLDRLDGVIYTGGQDVDPAVYGESPAEACGRLCPERDRLEQALLPLVLQRDLPTLGICRGLQSVNAFLGGSLWQDLPTQRPSGTSHRVNGTENDVAHLVSLVPGTPLAQLLQAQTVAVNSHHHQAVRTLAPCLREMARSEDGLTEAAYFPGKRFFWAVQWHPEMSYDASDESRRIFSAFVQACRAARIEDSLKPEPAARRDTQKLGFYGSEQARFSADTGYDAVSTPRDLYRALLRCWSAETCASRMRSKWTPDNPTHGQCSITSFLVQDLFGGKVYGVPLDNGYFHCYNVVRGVVFDLTSEQFGGEALCYENNPEQFRQAHFAMPEKKERYELLKSLLERYLNQ